jgi:ribosomal protein S18 acetylase RimI-like enzyme
MAENNTFIIRQMRRDDLDQALSLSLNEGWNQTMKDWQLLFENRDNVCIVAETDSRVAGTATALNHENKIAWIGMVLVDKSLRGRGAGKMLLENIIKRLKHLESVKLDATPAGEPLYRKLGFIEEHKIFRMTSLSLNYSSETVLPEESGNIDKENLSEVTKFDRKIFGADRNYLLMNLLAENPGRAFYMKKNNRPEGYVFGRAGSRFNYVGPVSALTQESARKLILKALKSLNDQNIALDILEDKVDMISWLESTGFVKQRHFVRMYLRSNPYPGIVNNQYLISGPEFG